MKRSLQTFFLLLSISAASAQANFSFNFTDAGQRVCLADVTVTQTPPTATIRLLDASVNSTTSTNIYRRQLYGTGADWQLVAAALPPGTSSWTDSNVAAGDVWEYQVKRVNGTNIATGYAAATIGYDQTNYRGRMILLVAQNITAGIPARYTELKKDLTGDGWLVQELIVPRAYGWDSGDTVVAIRHQVQAIYNASPADDKPKALFILGHVPLPRAGLGGQTPDAHIQNAGARGADTYYADVDGVFTDVGTYNPGGLSSPYAINLPGDFKWDQDTIPSALEMGFGRIDFADITSYPAPELVLTEQYLTRLHNYKQVVAGFDMGDKSAFYFGYNNSNDGAYRSLPAMSGAANVYQNTTGMLHPQWVRQNGPFMMYMQNVQAPQTGEWDTYGMDAAIYSSDQSYWGFGDVPEGNQYSKIRSILGADSKCVMVIWTTMGINIFHQLGTGEPVGLACRQIMDHNLTNQKLEKPSSPYDTPAWWNRTQFSLTGDPTIRLHQVMPATALQITAASASSILLQWTASADDAIAGYHIYKAATEFGKFERISGTIPLTGTSFTDNDPHFGEWYMVRAVKLQQTGTGIYFNPSQGIFIRNSLSVLPVRLIVFTAQKVNTTALLKWSAAAETDGRGFMIQRSSNANSWTNISFQPSQAMNGTAAADYTFTDSHPLAGNNYYRLQLLSASQATTYSAVKYLLFDGSKALSIFPNPASDRIYFSEAVSKAQLYGPDGKLLLNKKDPGAALDIRAFPKGIYQLRLTSATGLVEKFTVVKL